PTHTAVRALCAPRDGLRSARPKPAHTATPESASHGEDGRRRPKSAAHQKQEQRHRAGPLGGPHGSLGSALGPPPWRAPHTPGTLTNVTRAPRGGKRARPAAPACRAWPREGEGREEDMQQQEEQEGVAAAAQQGPRRRLAAAAQKMMSSSFFVLSSALGTSRADTGAGIARPLASSSFLSAIFSRSIFAFFFSTTFLTLKNSSRSISSISCVMYWMVSSMRGIRTYCRAFTRRLVILISSSRVLKAHCNEASLIRATIDLK
ncbi:unnamed protein product, partial [Prorocentrum cordatum]